MADNERLIVELEARIRDFERNLAKANASAQRNFGAIESRSKQVAARIEKNLGGIGAGVANRVTGALSGIGVALSASFGVDRMRKAADGFITVQNNIKATGAEGAKAKVVFEQLYQTAQRFGVGIEPLSELYNRASQSAAELRATQADMMRFTTGAAAAIKVDGKSPAEAAGALQQLSQLLAAGTVRAEEFNSVNEGAPSILKAVAAGMVEAGGSVAKLRTLMLDGKISSEAFFRAFLAGSGTMEQKAASATATSETGFTKLSNALINVIGRLDEATGATANFNSSATALSSYLESMPAMVEKAAASWASFKAAVNEAAGALNQLMGINDAATRAAGLDVIRNGKVVPPETNGMVTGGGFGAEPEASRSTPMPSRAQLYNRPRPVSIASFPVTSTPKSSGGSTGGKGGGSGSTEDVYKRETEAIREKIRALELEATTIGKTKFEAEKAKVVGEMEAAARKANITLTTEQKAKIDELGAAYANTAVKVDDLKKRQEEAVATADGLRNGIIDLGTTFTGALRQGQSFAEAFQATIDRLIDQLIEYAIRAAVFGVLGKAGTPLGGTGGGLFGGILGFASGGQVRGPGTGRSDSVLARLSDGEFVINAAATRRHGALLQAINEGKLPGFANGGLVTPAIGRAPSMRQAGGGNVTVNNAVTVNASGGTPQQNSDLAKQVSASIEATTRQIVVSEMQKQMRPGGVLRG